MPSNQSKTLPATHNPAVFILRHCMQQLLHEAINHVQKNCHGTLLGNGNIVTNNQSVTSTLFRSPDPEALTDAKNHPIGVYLSTNTDGEITPEGIEFMRKAQQQYCQNACFYYLILHVNHKGRIDAYIYTDIELQSSITLVMQEQA